MGNFTRLKPFSRKAADFAYRCPEADRRINILEGAVRSSKTWAMIPKLQLLSRYQVSGHKVIIGVSKQTVYNNILNDLFEVIPQHCWHYSRSNSRLELFGSSWQVIGVRDEGSEKYIRGLTVGVAYVDELTLIPQSSYNMLMSRMSPAGARFYATTNPDSPYHWLKTDVLDNWKLWQTPDIFVEHFTLDDNPHLEESFKESLKRQFAGVFYRRFINGEWVLAEGAIYGSVISEKNWYTDTERPIGLKSRGGHLAHWVGIDYGTVNPYVFIDVYDDGYRLWFDRERYYDSKKEYRQRTDQEQADDLLRFMDECAGRQLDPRERPGAIIDPSAASLKGELIRRGLYVMDARNDVDEGIRKVSAMLNTGKLKINRERCPEGAKEMETYSWDTKKAMGGKEQPVKFKDHYPDAARYIVNTVIDNYRVAA